MDPKCVGLVNKIDKINQQNKTDFRLDDVIEVLQQIKTEVTEHHCEKEPT